MKRVDDTYSNNAEPVRRKSKSASGKARNRGIVSRISPRWVAFAAIMSVTLMLCLSINYRAYSEMSREIDEHQTLSTQIESLTTENLALQEEIHNLKSEPKSIEREARRMGLRRSTDKHPVPAN